jgi:hypothetical protein
MTEYRYAVRDLLDAPADHSYAPFEGASFLRAYREQRERSRERLSRAAAAGEDAGLTLGRAVDAILANDAVPAGVETVDSPAAPGTGPCDSHAILHATWVHIVRGGDPALAAAWSGWLLPRFESRRRLHAAYDARGRASEGIAGADAHALLAALFAWAYRRDGDIRQLNALLKAGDILTSTRRHLAPSAALAALAALRVEMDAVRALLDAHRIRP